MSYQHLTYYIISIVATYIDWPNGKPQLLVPWWTVITDYHRSSDNSS